MTEQRITEHTSQQHNVMVISGIVRCMDCDEELDTSGHRPGLVEDNQWR